MEITSSRDGLAHAKFCVQLAPVVQKLDSAIHRINLYPLDNAIGSLMLIQWIVIYPVDSAIQLLNSWG